MAYRVLAVLPALLLLAGTAEAQSDKYVVCSARNKENTAGYVSPVTTIPATSWTDVQTSWGKLVSSKYAAFASSTGCMQAPTSAAAQSSRSRILDQMRDEGLKITDVAFSLSAEKMEKTAPAKTLTPEQVALAEMPAAQGYCEYNMQHLRTLFDCACFAKMVYHHRLAYGPESITEEAGRKIPKPVPQLLGGINTKLDASECLTDSRIDAYVDAMLNPGPFAVAQMNASQKSKLEAVRSCTKKTFAKKFRAEPYTHLAQKDFNLSQIECSGSKP